MLTKYLAPFLLAALPCSTRKGHLEMVVIVRATYGLEADGSLTLREGLDQGFLSGPVLADEDDRQSELLYPGDFADIKLNAEVLLKGSCFAPAGKPVPTCPVRFAVGAWSKSLLVTGPRPKGSKQPSPFTKAPIRWAHAFGGPGVARNPVGRGAGAEWPTVLTPSDLLDQASSSQRPAGLGPINPLWAPRAGKLGTLYGKAWRQQRAPYPADDFDWTYHHAAPADQQLSGYLRGDEVVVLQNLHPTRQVLETKLPGVRPRVVAHDSADTFRDVPLVLDTLFADLDELRLYLTWRGRLEVATDDLTDVVSLLLTRETLGARPRDLAELEAILRAFERDPAGLDEVLPPALLAAAERAGADGEQPDPTRDPVSAAMEKTLGRSDEVEQVAKAMSTVLDATEGGAANEPGKPNVRSQIEAAAAVGARDEPPMPLLHKPGHLADPGLRRALVDLERRLAPVEAELAAALAEAEASGAPSEARASLDGLRRAREAMRDPRLSAADPEYPPPRPPSRDAPGPNADLVDHDLSGLDLSGLDLSGADLSHAILVRTKLRGTNLRGAKLHRAVLFKADLTGADLTGADLTTCNASHLCAPGADLSDADLSLGFFHLADLSGARFVGCRASYPYLVEANLTEADLSRARLDDAELSGANLTGARLVGAELTSGRLNEVVAPRADFTRAKLSYCSFDKARLEGATFVDARATRTLFSDASLDDADLSYAWLLSCHFTGVSARRANFTAANLREARLDRAVLEHARFVTANLLRANLCKAQVGFARFEGANLYEAQLVGAAGERADFTGANVTRATFDRLR